MFFNCSSGVSTILHVSMQAKRKYSLIFLDVPMLEDQLVHRSCDTGGAGLLAVLPLPKLVRLEIVFDYVHFHKVYAVIKETFKIGHHHHLCVLVGENVLLSAG